MLSPFRIRSGFLTLEVGCLAYYQRRKIHNQESPSCTACDRLKTIVSYEPFVVDSSLQPLSKQQRQVLMTWPEAYRCFLVWCDIFDAMARRSMPMLAIVYRERLQLSVENSDTGILDTLDLWRETGCDSAVAYLISEIAVLECQVRAAGMDRSRLILAQTQLANLLDWSESKCDLAPISVYGRTTTAFRIAAKIYLCNLVPRHDRFRQTQQLIESLTGVLQGVHAGPTAYDLNLIWVYLAGGSYATPMSSFRAYFYSRLDHHRKAGDKSTLQVMERVESVLSEVWGQKDQAQTHVPGYRGDWRDVVEKHEWDLMADLTLCVPFRVVE